MTRKRKLTSGHRLILRMISDRKSVNHMDDLALAELRWFNYIDREFYFYTLNPSAYQIRGVKLR